MAAAVLAFLVCGERSSEAADNFAAFDDALICDVRGHA